ncbi:MAG TPA: hypothetical protein VK611_30350 [Acidimicrobiales bacterium]|nr:hypothetical protein [Acidimicrobiales bacterium]
MSVRGVIDHWGTTAEERGRRYPCDDVLPDAEQVLFRAVTVAAPPPVVFRWLCQLKVAPYSYDLLDNLGRRSPRHLVPGVEQLVVGERVVIFELASFATDEHLTLVTRRHRVFGDLAISYVVVPTPTGRSRLVVKLLVVPVRGLAGAVLRRLLPAGDLVMMRRQLLNLKALAEATTTPTST